MRALQQRIGYTFQNEELLALAMTHPSLGQGQNNQRLEFLGDAVLGLAVARLLYTLYAQEAEGDLARRQAALVRGETLTRIARSLDLGAALRLTSGEQQAGGRDNPSNLEDALEALIGALYLDGGLDAAMRFVEAHWMSPAREAAAPPKDAKTALQEWAQARGLPLPAYRLAASTGPAHAPEFTIEVTLPGYEPVEAKAASKRNAEQAAAAGLLAQLTKE